MHGIRNILQARGIVIAFSNALVNSRTTTPTAKRRKALVMRLNVIEGGENGRATSGGSGKMPNM